MPKKKIYRNNLKNQNSEGKPTQPKTDSSSGFGIHKEETVNGIFRMHAKGFGFVTPDHLVEYRQDIFIPKHLTNHAVDGDHVEVMLLLETLSDKGPEGRIVCVLKRARKHLAGTIHELHANGNSSAYVPILGVSKPVVVLNHENSLNIGDRV